ncbi:hypothetical protein BGX27_008175 [Mortierella sp. AM989]|nr:hypothetical protein BGX27_008175 [Mortierella sp. AM989]
MNFDDEEAQFAEAIRRSLQESLITPSNPSPASYPPPAVEPPRLVSPQPTTKPQVIDLTDDDIPIKVEKGSKPAQEDLRIPSLNNSRTQTHSVTNNPGSSNVNSTNNNSNNRVNSSAHSMPISHASDVTNGYTRDLLNNHANDLLNSYARDYYNNHAKETGEDEETPSRNTRNIASDYEDHLMDNYERTLLSNFERDAINKYNTFNNFADDIMNNHEDTINDDMDDESDEDMKRALALSLAEISTQHTPEPMTAESRTVTPDVASPLLSLNREQMEKERLERIKKRALSTSKAEAGRQHADEPKRQRRKEAELAITPPASVPEPTFALASSSSIPATSQASKPKPSAEINPDSAHIPTLESTPGLLKPKVTPRRAKTAVPRKPRSLPKAPASASEIPSSPIKSTPKSPLITGKVPGHFEIQFNDLVVKEHIVKAVLTAFEVDEEWLEQQLPHNITQCIVRNWHREAGDKPGICTAGKVVFVHPPLSGMGTFHTKLMMLFYPTFCRVVVTSANLVPHDWEQLVNTVYVQDFAMLPAAVQTPEQLGDFGSTLYNYLKVMTLPDKILSVIKAVDFSTAKVLLVPTVQGSYLVNSQHTYGIAQLSKVLQARGLQGKELEVEYQTSSLGKLTLRFLDEFYRAARGLHVRARSRFADEERLPPIKVVFPTERHVHGSRLREDGAGTICLQSQFWEHPTFPRRVMHDFECAGSLKGSLMHSKIVLAKVSDQPSNATTYIPVPGSVIPRQEAISNCVGWFYVGSANFTESAWGTVTNKRATAKNVNGIHINMRNWELGVVYIIETEDEMHDLAAISAAQRLDPSGELSFFGPLPVPYMRPLTQYNDRDKPWIR